MEGSSIMSAKPSVIGEGVRHFAAGKIASFEVDLQDYDRDQVTISITSPSKRQLSSRIVDGDGHLHHVEFNPSEVGSYVIDVNMDGVKVQGSPFIAKAYDSSQIRVSDVTNGAVGQPCQFRGKSFAYACAIYYPFLCFSIVNTTLLSRCSGRQSSWRRSTGNIHQRRRGPQSRPGTGRGQVSRQFHAGNSQSAHDRNQV